LKVSTTGTQFTRRASLGALYLALSLLMCAPLFAVPNGVGWRDWDQHLFYYASVLKSVVEYGQLPFWNPWYCGGNVLWQNPQVALLSPVYPLALLMSLPLAMKVNIVLHYWIGFAGMHLLLRRVVGLRSLPLTIFLGVVYVGCGALAMHLAEGHSVFLPAFYLPVQLFWVARSISGGQRRYALLAGAVLGLTVWNGGLHIVPMMAVGIGVFASTAATLQRSWRPLLLAGLCGVAGLAYAAPKLIPMVMFLKSDRFTDERILVGPDLMSMEMVRHAYVDHDQDWMERRREQAYLWHEYGNYIGWPAAILIVMSLGWIFLRPRPPGEWMPTAFAVAAVALFIVTLGEFSSFAPATLMQRVPLLSKFRIPSRFAIAFTLFAVTSAGCMLRRVSLDALARPAARWILTIACLVAASDICLENSRHFVPVFRGAPLDGGFHYLRRPDAPIEDDTINPFASEAAMLRAMMSGRAVFRCYEPLKLVQLADPGLPLTSSQGPLLVATAKFAPNHIDVRVVGGRETSRLLINQNYAPGWRSSLGPVTPEPRYQNLSIEAPPDAKGTYSVVFVPPGIVVGLVIFAAALAISAAAK
jgi:hypothetical protein